MSETLSAAMEAALRSAVLTSPTISSSVVRRLLDTLDAERRTRDTQECAICGATVPAAIWTRHLENGCQPEDAAPVSA